MLAAAVFATFAAFPAWGTTVFVTSVGYNDAQLIINGVNVRSMQIGEISPEGVRLVDIQNGVAVLEIDGRSMSLRIGQSTVSQTTLTADARGHFVAAARINGVPVRALIDTGATFVSLGVADAQRMGVNYLQGKPGVSQTANGPISVYLVNLTHVQVGDIAFYNVPGMVTVSATAQQTPVLIGMSFLRLVEMRRSGSTMTLMRADR